MSCEDVVKHIERQQSALLKENDSLDILSQANPNSVVKNNVIGQAVENAVNQLSQSPLAQLGEDFIAEQIQRNGTQLLNNVTKEVESQLNTITGIPVRKTLADAQSTVFNTISAALTAQNDLQFYFLQQLANNCINALDRKIQIATLVREKLRELYNALVILTAGDPFFFEYLRDLREAIRLLDSAQQDFTLVRNTFEVNDTFLKRLFDIGVDKLNQAEGILAPEQDDPANKFTDSGLLANVGIPSEPQQLTLILSIPRLVTDVLQAADGYFIANLEANALLLAFRDGLFNFQNSSSEKLKEYTLDTLDQIISRTSSLVDGMATEVNGVAGNPEVPERQGPVSGEVTAVSSTQVALNTDVGFKVAPRRQYQTLPQVGRQLEFRPDPVKTSSLSLGWVFQLRTIIEFCSFVPGQTLQDLNTSNLALQRYNEAVECIKTKNTVSNGDAVLTATEGREETGQFESQLTTFTLEALQSIVDAEVADGILSLGRTTIARMDLAIEFNTEVRNCLEPFANADLAFPDALQRTGDGINDLLDNFGLDRAKDQLATGNFAGFFNLNSKTATFAGAALAGLAVLKECVGNTEDQELLTQAEREIQRDQAAKELLQERSSLIGFEAQKAENEQRAVDLQTTSERACDAADKCGLPNDFRPTSLVKNIGSVLGVSLVGGGTNSKNLSRIGRGIF
jgi:hypothetical protein